jgi:hypothetical protein
MSFGRGVSVVREKLKHRGGQAELEEVAALGDEAG